MERSPKRNGGKTKEGNFAVALKKAISNEDGTTAVDVDKAYDEESKRNALARTISRQKDFQDKLKNPDTTFHIKDPMVWSKINGVEVKKNEIKSEEKD